MRDARSNQTVRPQAFALGVLVDAPDPLADQRLAPALPPAVAGEIRAALVADTLAALSLVPMRHRVVLAAPERDGVAAVEAQAPRGFKVVAQRGASRIERQRAAIDDLFALGAEAAVLASAVCPLLPIGDAFDAMLGLPGRKRILLGPTTAGGVYFLGLSRPVPSLFDGIEDGPRAPSLAALRARAEQSELEVVLLPERTEIATEADLRALARDPAAASAGATMRLLTSLSL